MGSIIDFFNSLIRPIEYVVAWIMVGWHSLLTMIGLPAASGWTWALSIVGLVIVIRILLIPLFVRQIHASRRMQLMQPEFKKLQEKYKGKTDPESKQRQQQEMMELYRNGGNPLSSCLPMLAQGPIFYALFRVLNGIPNKDTIGPLNDELVRQADAATLFGAPLSSTFMHSGNLTTKVLTVVLIALMTLTTFTTQRQLMMKNMPATAMDNPYMQQQKILLYVLPVVFAVSGVNFPIGVLLYWLTTNLWSMGQQFYVIHRMPAPGSPAEKALHERRARKGIVAPEAATAAGPAAGPVIRQQPKRQSRSQRRGPGATGGPASPAGPAGPGGRSGTEREPGAGGGETADE